MTVSAFDPFSSLDRVLSRMTSGGSVTSGQSLSVPMDVYRRGEEFLIEVDIPGVDASSIDMTVERNMVTVAGEIHAQHHDDDEVVLCERPHARFRRQVYLGDNLDTDNIQADYDKGVLRIRVPVIQQERARKVEVSAGDQRPAEGGTIDAESTDQS
jgi:HSP20 family protein